MSYSEKPKIGRSLDERERTNIYELLNKVTGFSPDEVQEYFTITKNEEKKEFLLILKSEHWLEGATNAAMQNMAKKKGGSYQPKPTIFTIPDDNDATSQPQATQEQETDEQSYSLAASREGLGELTPVLLDAYGAIIDGFHRRKENPEWHAVTVPHIDNPIKRELARLAVNFARRKVPDEELMQRLTFLSKAGLKPEEIAEKTGISKRTIFRHLPQDLKDQKKVEAGLSRAGIANRGSVVPRVTTNITTPDIVPRGTSIEHDDIVEALDAAEYPHCPECSEEPVHNEELPWVLCSKGHEWNLNTGALKETKPCSYLDELVEGSSCHLSVDSSKVENGVCDVCRQKTAEKPSPSVSQEPPHEEPKPQAATTRPTKPVNYDALGEFCPICGAGISKEKFERLKAKFGPKYPGLFAKPIEEKEDSSANPFDDED